MSVATPVLSQAVPASTPFSSRLASLDIFRGITIAMMVLVNNDGKGEPYAMLDHAKWHGWTPTDLVFPFFLFIVGVATPFSLAKRGAAAVSKLSLFGHIWSRALALFMLGQLLQAFPQISEKALPEGFLVLKVLRIMGFALVWGGIGALLIPWRWKRIQNWLPVAIAVSFYALAIAMHFAVAHAKVNGWPADVSIGRGIHDPDFVRIPGILQRIGICFGIAASLALFAGWRTMIVSIVVLCAAYSGVMLGAKSDSVPRGSISPTTNIARLVDETVFDRWTTNAAGERAYAYRHTWRQYPDPEGIVSTLPAVATAGLGVLVGWWLRRPDRLPAEKCAGLMAMAVPVGILGFALDGAVMPINKSLWTPAFVFLTGGLAMLGLGFVFWLADVRQWRWWALPFKIFGMNAIAAFVLSSLIVRIGWMIRFAGPSAGETVGLTTYCQNRVYDAVHHWSNQLQASNPSLPVLATPQNTSLAYALCFVAVVFACMALMYVCRVFVKV
jgi:predicted acyltransferase